MHIRSVPLYQSPESLGLRVRAEQAALCLQMELQEVVDFFTKPKLFRSSGARIPKGVLLCGPPGTLLLDSIPSQPLIQSFRSSCIVPSA